MSDSLWPHGLYSPWDSPGQNIGLDCCSLLQGIFPTQDPTQVSCIAGGFFTSWVTRETQQYWSGGLSLLQRIFLAQELNWGLLHCWQILYQLSYQGSPWFNHIALNSLPQFPPSSFMLSDYALFSLDFVPCKKTCPHLGCPFLSLCLLLTISDVKYT